MARSRNRKHNPPPPEPVYERDPPPGWCVDAEGSIFTGSIACYPPGSVLGSERTPRISSADERTAIQAAWQWVRGEIPLHYMSVSRFRDDETLINLVRYHLGLPMDPRMRDRYERWYTKRRSTAAAAADTTSK